MLDRFRSFINYLFFVLGIYLLICQKKISVFSFNILSFPIIQVTENLCTRSVTIKDRPSSISDWIIVSCWRSRYAPWFAENKLFLRFPFKNLSSAYADHMKYVYMKWGQQCPMDTFFHCIILSFSVYIGVLVLILN